MDARVVSSPGMRLRETREARGLSLTDAASRLHLTAKVVEELESDCQDVGVELPFMRGYLRNYAKLLDLPVDELVRDFDRSHGHKAPEPVKPIVHNAHLPLESSSPWGYVIGIGLLVAVAAGYLGWQSFTARSPGAVTSVQSAASGSGLTAGSEPNAKAGLDQPVTPETRSPSTPVTTNATPATAAPETTAVGPSRTSAAQPPLGASRDSESARQAPTALPEEIATASRTGVIETPSPAAGQAQLAMVFSGDCWIKIEDSTGTVLSRGLKRAGANLSLAGAPPFKLVLGNPGAVSLSFRGEAVDLSQYPVDKVAKLQLGTSG